MGDAVLGAHAVEEVQVGLGAELVDPGLGERGGLLVLLGAGAGVGVGGQRLVGGQVPAGQAGGAGPLAEHLDAGGVLLGGLAAPLAGVRVDGEGDRGGDLLDLGVGLGRRGGQLGDEEGLGGAGVLIGQVGEDLRDQPRLGRVEDPGLQQRADLGEPGAELPRGPHGLVGRRDGGGQG